MRFEPGSCRGVTEAGGSEVLRTRRGQPQRSGGQQQRGRVGAPTELEGPSSTGRARNRLEGGSGGATGEVGAEPSEAEHGQGDEGVGGFEPECDSNRPHRRRAPLRGRTDTTIASISSSKAMPSMTVPTSPSTRCHTLAFRTPFALPVLESSRRSKTREQAGCAADRPTQSPTDGSGEPEISRFLKFLCPTMVSGAPVVGHQVPPSREVSHVG